MLCLSYHNFLNNTRWKHWSIKVQGQSFYDIWRQKSYIKIFYSWPQPHNFQRLKIFIQKINYRYFHFHFLENKTYIYYNYYTSNLYKFMKVFIHWKTEIEIKGHQQLMLDRLMKVLPDTTRNQFTWWAIQICILWIQNMSKKSLEFQNL